MIHTPSNKAATRSSKIPRPYHFYFYGRSRAPYHDTQAATSIDIQRLRSRLVSYPHPRETVSGFKAAKQIGAECVACLHRYYFVLAAHLVCLCTKPYNRIILFTFLAVSCQFATVLYPHMSVQIRVARGSRHSLSVLFNTAHYRGTNSPEVELGHEGMIPDEAQRMSKAQSSEG